MQNSDEVPDVLSDDTVAKRREVERAIEFKEAVILCSSTMSLPLYLVFWLCDLVYAPDLKWFFLALRLLMIPNNLTFAWICRTQSLNLKKLELMSLWFAFFNGILITIMIFSTTGPDSPYYAGLNLVALGILAFFPWSKRIFLWVICAIFLPYYLSVLFCGIRGIQSTGLKSIYIHSFFIFGTIMASAIVWYFRERLKLGEIRARIGTEIAKLALEGKNKELETILTTLRSTQASLVQAEKMASLGSIASILAHEVNNSMQSTRWAAAGAKKLVDALPEDQTRTRLSECLELINRGVTMTKDVVANVRSYSGDGTRHEAPLQVKNVIEAVLRLCTLKLQEHGSQTIKVEIKADEPLWVLANSAGLHQMIMNLVNNAIDAMPEGGTLTVSTRAEDPWCVISVADTGFGMTEEIQKQIFEPFFTTKKDGKGTGLGLYVVKQEVDRYNGTISVNSEPMMGTVFVIKLKTVNPPELKQK
jgi:signal transduction histidine kinase